MISKKECIGCGYACRETSYKYCPRYGKALGEKGRVDPGRAIKQAKAAIARDRLSELRVDTTDPYERMMNIKAAGIMMRHRKPVRINSLAQNSVNMSTQQGMPCSTCGCPVSSTRNPIQETGGSSHLKEMVKGEGIANTQTAHTTTRFFFAIGAFFFVTVAGLIIHFVLSAGVFDIVLGMESGYATLLSIALAILYYAWPIEIALVRVSTPGIGRWASRTVQWFLAGVVIVAAIGASVESSLEHGGLLSAVDGWEFKHSLLMVFLLAEFIALYLWRKSAIAMGSDPIDAMLI